MQIQAVAAFGRTGSLSQQVNSDLSARCTSFAQDTFSFTFSETGVAIVEDAETKDTKTDKRIIRRAGGCAEGPHDRGFV